MIYITGIHALNIICNLNTGGDWHAAALQWACPQTAESDGSLFENYGIESGKTIPEHKGTYYVANHIRALLDLLENGQFGIAEGMRNDFIVTNEYDDEIFQKVYSMKKLPSWTTIDDFMEKEYMLKWIRWKENLYAK